MGNRSNRRGSRAPYTSRLREARSHPSYLRRSQPGPRPRAPRARGSSGWGARGGAERPAAASSPVESRSLPRSLSPFCLSVRGPSLPAAPAPAQQRVPSCLARQSAGSRARGLVPCPPLLPAPRGAGHGLLGEVPLPKGEAVGARAGRSGEDSRGRLRDCALGSLPIPVIPAGERLGSAGAPGSGGRDGAPRLAAKGARGEGVRGSDSRARGCECAPACLCVCACVCACVCVCRGARA